MFYIEIVREARIDGPNLIKLLKTPLKFLEDNCLNSALLAAVESGSPNNVGELILHGATNIDLALTKSRSLKQPAVTAALLMIKAAMENDRILVLKLYGENFNGEKTKIPLGDDNLAELQAAVSSNNIETLIPIEISIKSKSLAVTEELLLRTDVDEGNKVVLWHYLGLRNLEVSLLNKIQWVKKLNLAHNYFISLPPEMGRHLMHCIELDLQHNKLHKIPQSLLELPRIKTLNLSHNDLSIIPGVSKWSASLEVLDLSYNYLSKLPNSIVASALTNLNISNNQFRSVPHCVCSFIGLITLNIANNCGIVALPPELGRLKDLISLNLDGLDRLKDPPKSVQASTIDCIQYLKSIYRLRNGTYRYYHMKMILVGKQAVGKSTLVARLQNKDIGSESTVGVDISEWKYAPSRIKKTFHFSVWDLAGQREYYATNQCFLSKYSLCLLVWNIIEGDGGIDDLKPWLNTISARAPGSPVIIVGTFLDKVSEEDRRSGILDGLLQKVAELTQQYDQLNVTNVTVVGLKGQMENVGRLKDYVYNAATEYEVKGQPVMGQLIPSCYHALDAKLSTIHHLVKEGKHEPIMLTAEFQKMAMDCNLVDIQNDADELYAVTHFLCEAGSLLHYEDHKHNLDHLYFVDPHWLYDLMSMVVTVKGQNPYVKQGVLRSKNLFRDKQLPYKYFDQFLTLLNRFEIALPLDKDHKRVLIPSMLPGKCPDIVAQQQPDYNSCYKRIILLCPTVDGLCCPTPPGLWSRLLSRIMNTVEEVKYILSEQVPVEDDDFFISTNIQRNTSASDTWSIYNNVFEESTASLTSESHPSPSESHEEVFPFQENKSLTYWSTGLVYNVNELAFSIQSLAESTEYHDKDGILILASQGSKGCKILCQLIDIVEKLIAEWYPGLSNKIEQRVPCSECIKESNPNPYEFRVEQLILLIADQKLSHKCDNNHTVQLIEIVPDLLLADLDSKFVLDLNKLIYVKEKENLLGTGTFGEVYRGVYGKQTVAIKLYTSKDVNSGESFRELRSESKVLQQLIHPCLVCMVGVTVTPTMSLVLELAPEGSLQTPLLKQQRSFSRIVLYRIAIQVASALHFLHSIDIIYRDLKADDVLLWSLSPDHLINCKLTDFNSAAHTDPGGTKGLYGTTGFIAPEVSHINRAKEHSVYDHRADIFSFGMFLYQVVARRHPFHNIKPVRVQLAIEEDKRPQLEDISIAEVGLYYMTRVMKLCWVGDPAERPTSQQIIEWLSASALQLIVSVVPFNGKCSLHNGCIVTPDKNDDIGLGPTSSELWIFCGKKEGELNIFNANTMERVHKHSLKENKMHCMKQCGQYVWMYCSIDFEFGVVNIFHKTNKNLVQSIKIKDNGVSCITNSDHLVYLGTMEGNCFVFPIDITNITDRDARKLYVSENCINGLALSENYLWVSLHDQIHFLKLHTLRCDGVIKREKNKGAYVGKLMLSDNGDIMWSAHIRGVILSAWNAHQRTHITDVDVSVCAEEKCHIVDLQARIMTAMCVALDTVWIGLSSGYIMVFAMDPSGELLTYFRPYNDFIRFLSATKYPGPCQKEECMMLCGGKMYQPDNRFIDLPDYAREDEAGEPVDKAGVAVLWEVLPAKYMRQVQYLSDGTSWLNYSTIEQAMNDTGFTESLQYCRCKSACNST